MVSGTPREGAIDRRKKEKGKLGHSREIYRRAWRPASDGSVERGAGVDCGGLEEREVIVTPEQEIDRIKKDYKEH